MYTEHLHMHQHTHQNALNPIMHQSLTILPAPMAAQDANLHVHHPGGAARPSFTPVTAFHRATQKSFRSTFSRQPFIHPNVFTFDLAEDTFCVKKRGRWGALHVCIAWKIYYHEQLKKIQKRPNSLPQETPERAASSPPESVQQESESCKHLKAEDSPCGQTSFPSDLHSSSPASCQITKKENQEKVDQVLSWKEKHGAHQTETPKDLPLRDSCPAVTPELDCRHGGSLVRKRQLECDGFSKAKRVKKEFVDEHLDFPRPLPPGPSPFSTAHTHPSSHAVPVQHMNPADLSVLYANRSRCNVSRTPGRLVYYPGAEMNPYQSVSWEPVWDTHKTADLQPRQSISRDFSLNGCKAIGIPVAAQRPKEAFHAVFPSPHYFPLALRQQETVYLQGRELLHAHHLHSCRHALPHPGFLATPYLGP